MDAKSDQQASQQPSSVTDDLESWGWIKIHRKLLNNPRSADPAWLIVWINILCRATHKPLDVLFNGERLTLKPGQLVFSSLDLSRTCGIPRTTIDRRLELLENEQQIEQRVTHAGRLVTVTNWDKYQLVRNGLDNGWATSGQRRGTHYIVQEVEEGGCLSAPATSTNDPEPAHKQKFPPSFEDVLALFQAAPALPDSEAQKFFDYWSDCGWRRKKGPMKSLKGSVSTWKQNYLKFHSADQAQDLFDNMPATTPQQLERMKDLDRMTIPGTNDTFADLR